ncbi:hypothetical protein ACFODZ_15560 [Marinicella sediminis]|uniref:Uncharacterized protein n=1 Tax=Marinicella sediminis TaxID=1792834 RepID=A0ABV7JG58_9GAMM|nr:hypothetical protein [Marinicella sediminis]
MTTNIDVIVDFDGIVANVPHDSNDYYTRCEGYVTYQGEGVDGATLNLIQGQQYTLTLYAKDGDQCSIEGLHGFTDTDLQFLNDGNPNQLAFVAQVIDKEGKDVFFEANFTNTMGSACTARWDPTIIITDDPD